MQGTKYQLLKLFYRASASAIKCKMPLSSKRASVVLTFDGGDVYVSAIVVSVRCAP